jgi:hypothetical protein
MSREFYFHKTYSHRGDEILLQYKMILYWRLIVLTFYINKREPVHHFIFENDKDKDGKFEYARFITLFIPIGTKIFSIQCNIYPE